MDTPKPTSKGLSPVTKTVILNFVIVFAAVTAAIQVDRKFIQPRQKA